ncbi:ribulose-phosphate 3-epimerase, partial [Mesorhizobium japonicum]
TDVDRWAPGYAELGAFSVTFHAEATADPVALARRLRGAGARAGGALKPNTPPSEVVAHLDEFDQVLVMTVEPGFGGQG